MKISCGRLAVIGVVSIAIGGLAACGSAGSPAGTSGSPAPAAGSSSGTGRAAAFNGADIGFARTMVAVEGQSEAMASLAAGRAASSQVRQYAIGVRDQARMEQQQMRGWLRGWHQAGPQPWSPGAAAPYRMGPGMMGFPGWSGYWGDMGRGWHAMGELHGPGFDAAWTAMMARGYSAEIALARGELRSGVSTAARGLAGAMLASRQAGLARLQRWYRDWGGPGWSREDWWDRWNGWNWPNGWQGNGQSRWNGWNGWNGGCGCW